MRILFTGPSGTGKSVCLNLIEEIFEKQQNIDQIYIQKSITRSFYKMKNIENEITLQNMGAEEKHKFQIDLFDYYITYTLDKTIEQKHFLIDRSPIDIISYTLWNNPEMKKSEYDDLINKTIYFFKKINEKNKVSLVFFEYPVPWSKYEENSSDGFRYDPFGKNYTNCSVMKAVIEDLFNKDENIFNFIKVPIYNNNKMLSVAERTMFILKHFE